MINPNPAYNLRVPEFIQFGYDLSSVITNANPVSLVINKQYLAYKSVIDSIQKVYQKSLSSPLTKTLLDLDTKRDNLFLGICFIVDGYAKSWLPEHVAFSKLINQSIKVHGRKFVRANYQSVSAILSSLIDNWQNDAQLKAAFVGLNLDSWCTELYNTNELFQKTHSERSEENAEKYNFDNIKNLRVKAAKSWAKFEKVLLGKMEELEDDATKAALYTALINNINELFDKYHILISQRKGRKAKKDKTPVAPK